MFDQMYICQTIFFITNKNTVFALLDEAFHFSKTNFEILDQVSELKYRTNTKTL